ncbi:MAG: hypothetical protein N3B01_05950 [Verrucomicrobiae bacterium]|nr:hypothetical protein [Verrucomicrobiae bacterium]
MRPFLALIFGLGFATGGFAGVGDPQLATDHPWYPGELAMSSFERLFATQAAQYERATGKPARTEQDRALASWFFRNTHYAHGEDGRENLWGKGFINNSDSVTRDYWTGLFAHGFGLCGTTHAQWTAELDTMLGRCRSRVVGTRGHNSFEVFLTGEGYGDGRWALLDHDLSTVIFDALGRTLLGLDVVSKNWKTLATREHAPARQQGWLPCGLHPDDGGAFGAYRTAEYMAGYAGAPPIVYLRKGERLRRWFEPGLEDGKTFVFWGRNYRTGGIPGPERSRTWVNQPEKMFGSKTGTPHMPGQARYGNAQYIWQPDFAGGGYKEGVADESDRHVTLEFYTPYIIGATPAGDGPWDIYQPGCRNGLVLRGMADCPVAVSTDGGITWQDCGPFKDGMDLTDHVKGHRQWHLRLGASAARLAGTGLTIITVCQANPAAFPRLKDGGTRVTLEMGGRGVVRFGPNVAQAKPCIVQGAFDSPRVTLEFKTPRGEPVRELHVAAHVASGNPPSPDVRYQMEYSLDGGRTWLPLLKDGRIERRGEEPKDFWSQSMWFAHARLPDNKASSVQVRLHNDGGKRYRRVEGHLIYPVATGRARVTYHWTDDRGAHEQSRVLGHKESWDLPTGRNVRTRWAEVAAE